MAHSVRGDRRRGRTAAAVVGEGGGRQHARTGSSHQPPRSSPIRLRPRTSRTPHQVRPKPVLASYQPRSRISDRGTGSNAGDRSARSVRVPASGHQYQEASSPSSQSPGPERPPCQQGNRSPHHAMFCAGPGPSSSRPFELGRTPARPKCREDDPARGPRVRGRREDLAPAAAVIADRGRRPPHTPRSRVPSSTTRVLSRCTAAFWARRHWGHRGHRRSGHRGPGWWRTVETSPRGGAAR